MGLKIEDSISRTKLESPQPPPLSLADVREIAPNVRRIDVVDVVVVDDCPVNRRLLLRILKQLGVSCESCENGKQVVEILTGLHERLVRCQLVLMDKEMPVMDGYAAATALRASPLFRGHIIGVTGNALDTQISEFLKNGVEAVITKPVKSKQIEMLLLRYGILPERTIE
eukprot:c17962_g1_i1.p1 GENE.c17962_g1_i1~~c17962_g1_i1.p1  ORF type:complete len:170 (-),score=41.96 c17962_g1_i1:52-561(-)